MARPVLPSTTDADHYDALVAAAKARARTLRREAIGAFWDGFGAWCHQGVDSGQRAARRLAQRLRQHAQQRTA